MPSGSHGGGGGSHFSGGSSFGGGGSRGGSSGGGGGRPRGPMRFHIGHHYFIISEGRAGFLSFLTALMFMAIFLIVTLSITLGVSDKAINKIKVDRAYYLDMIEYAELHNEYLVNGEVTDRFYNEDCDRWYVTYKINYQENGVDKTLNGYTFSVYTSEAIRSIRVGDSMQLAVNSNPITSNTDSINVDYKNIPLTDDGEYIKCINGKKISITIISIASVVVAGCIAGAILIVIKSKQKQQAKVAEEKAKELAEEKRLNRRCPYCSGKLSPDDKKCPNCGASLD